MTLRQAIEALIADLREEALRAHDGLQTTSGVTNAREVEATYKEQLRLADRLTARIRTRDETQPLLESLVCPHPG